MIGEGLYFESMLSELLIYPEYWAEIQDQMLTQSDQATFFFESLVQKLYLQHTHYIFFTYYLHVSSLLSEMLQNLSSSLDVKNSSFFDENVWAFVSYNQGDQKQMCARRLQIYAAQIGFSTAKTTGYRFKYNSHMIPHPAKAYKGGEDAIFTSDNVLVVADGVGGWADHGIDPGLYSKMLCKLIGEKVKKNLTKYIDNPQQLLSEAVSENRQLGSTTVCMLLLNPETGVLKSYYLGDSVYGIFREGEVEMMPEQQKSFNFPFQIGSTGDDPSEGVLSEYKEGSFKETDLIVMGSDGIWDNYDVAEIYQVVKKNPFEKSAEMVAKNAFKKSLMDNYESPFYKRAKEVGIRFEKSGKPDDISVIVSKIVKEEL